MRAGRVVIIEVGFENAVKMAFAKNDHMVEAFSANGTDQSLDVRILPRRVRGTDDFLDAQVLDAILEPLAVDAIAVTVQVSWRLIERKCLGDLPSRPFGGGMSGDVEVNDAPPVMAENDEAIQHAKRGGRHGEEINGRRHWTMWLLRNVRQVCDGGLAGRVMYLATVDSARS